MKKSLEKLTELLKPAGDVLKEYFSCCNEINYFTEEDSVDGKCFDLRATAYSGIGSGALFRVDVNKGTVKLVGKDTEKLIENENGDDDCGLDEEQDVDAASSEQVRPGKHCFTIQERTIILSFPVVAGGSYRG